MVLKLTYGCCNLRNVSIFLGVVSTIVWTIAAVLSIQALIGNSDEIWRSDYQNVMLRVSSGTITFAVVSVFMTYGVFKSKPDYMFPWVSIHFAYWLYYFWHVLAVICTPHVDRRYIRLAPVSILGCIIAISWHMVYVYYKRLMTEMQKVQPSLCPDDATIVRDPKSPEHLRHPV